MKMEMEMEILALMNEDFFEILKILDWTGLDWTDYDR